MEDAVAKKQIALNIAGVVFLVVSIVHLLRVIFRVEVIINQVSIPIWYSGVLALVAFALSLLMFKAIR